LYHSIELLLKHYSLAKTVQRKSVVIKRVFDIFASALGLLLLSPVFLIIAILVRLKLGAPIFFRQTRPGKDCQPFEMIKFRTMIDAYDKDGNPLSDSERITHFGRLLRKTSLDELPELWNVLKGDMSIVGPRPLLMRYLPYYTEAEMVRHEVKPGLTGLAQVSGRNSATWEEKFELDLEYVESKSLFLDFEIIFKTVWVVLKRSDVLDAAPQGPLDKYREGLNERKKL